MTGSPQHNWGVHTLGWQEANVRIVNKMAELVPLIHNIAQLKIYNTKQLQRVRDIAIRLIICKARQEGVSTGEAADMFEDINRKRNRANCLISADAVSTAKVFKMIKRMQDEIPDEKKREPEHSNRQEISYPKPHFSSVLCQTAGKDVLGRGGTTHKVHATEVSIWPRAAEKLDALFQEVPEHPDTSIVLESTAYGTTGDFHDRFWIAADRMRANAKAKIEDYTGYLPVFLPWHIFPDYQMRVPKGIRFEVETGHEVYGDEQELITKFGCTVEQLFWRRHKIINDFKNYLPRFMQEYPATAREAFQGTGRMVFLPTAIDKLEEYVRPPKDYIEFYRSESGRVKWRSVLRREHCWSIWKWPIKNHHYVEFGDVAAGKLSDPTNPQSQSDRSVAGFIDRQDYDVPAVYYGRPTTIEFGDQMLLAAEFYNYAWATPEMNMGIGQSILDTFKRANYSCIYMREKKEEEIVSEESVLMGWMTTTKTRKPMIADLIEVVNEGGLKIYDIRIIRELRTFVRNSEGKEVADVGQHDDCVLMLAGCIQLYNRCPAGSDDYSWLNKKRKESGKGIAYGGEVAEEDDDEDSSPGRGFDPGLMYQQEQLEKDLG